MKKMRRYIAAMGMSAILAVSCVIPAFAGSWYNIDDAWYFSEQDEDEGEYFLTGWQWIDGYCYYLNPAAGGAMAVLTVTPDGFMVDADGHWINQFGIPYYLEGMGFSASTGQDPFDLTSLGPAYAGMAYDDPALTGPSYEEPEDTPKYPGDGVIVSGSTGRSSSSPGYGSLSYIFDLNYARELWESQRSSNQTEESVEEMAEEAEKIIERAEETLKEVETAAESKEEEKSEESKEKAQNTGSSEESEDTGKQSAENEKDTSKDTPDEKDTESRGKDTEDKGSQSDGSDRTSQKDEED